MNPAGLRQPDQRSCGATAVVVARMLLDPRYAARVRTRFADEVLATHRRITRCVDARGRLQPPWPRLLGTPPWAVAAELSSYGPPHRVRTGIDLSAVRAAVSIGRPVPLYVGSRLLPRHVLLALPGAPGAEVQCYDPATGAVGELVAGGAISPRWPQRWFTVLPRPARPAARRTPA